MRTYLYLFIGTILIGCKTSNDLNLPSSTLENLPNKFPKVLFEAFVPQDKIVHKGIFSPDLDFYYYTVSNQDYTNFDIYLLQRVGEEWLRQGKADINSDFDDHGMSFAPDGNTIYFSSTRPTDRNDVASTWHIWASQLVGGQWLAPIYIDIPNLRSQLTSHPILTRSGTLYFHSSNADYSNMDIYQAQMVEGRFSNARKSNIDLQKEQDRCTPYVSADEDFMVFAAVGESLNLMITYNDGKGHWINTKPLSQTVNEFGQGNPSMILDDKYLIYTTGGNPKEGWKVKWVDLQSEIDHMTTH